jgi:hypothetical protein
MQPLPLKVKEKQQQVMIASRLILVFVLALISWQATIRSGVGLPFENGDKILHFFAFAALAALVDFAFPKSRFGALKITALIFYGVSIEFVQSFLPYRSASLIDLMADIFGIGTYMVSIPVLKRLPLFRDRWGVESGPRSK